MRGSKTKPGLTLREANAERFWAKVKFVFRGDSCWEWTGALHKAGYGIFSFREGPKARCHRAHGVSFRLAKGNLDEGVCVLHKCDNPRRVRPDHLWAGSQQENIDDMVKKGRHKHGIPTR